MQDLTQEELNADMQQIGMGRYRARVESSKERKAESNNKYGQRLIRGGLPVYAKAIRDLVQGWTGRNNARWQNDLKQEAINTVAFVALRSIIDVITKKSSMAKVAYFVGSKIEDQCRCSFVVKKNPERGEGIILGAKRKSHKGYKAVRKYVQLSSDNEAKKGLMPSFEQWSRRDRIACGLNLVELLRASTGVIEYVYILEKGRKKPTRFVTASKQTIDWIESFNADRELIEPFWLPTVDTPEDWTSIWKGGYRTEGTNLPTLPFIKTTNMEMLRAIDKPIEIPMRACNLLQNTPWKINDEVLDVMQWAWHNSVKIGGLPNRKDEELPDIPNDFHTNPTSNRIWRRTAAGIYSRNASTTSRRLLVAKIMYLAQKMRDARFFTPVHCDFRGRVYTIPSFLSNQGADMCRGLLKFARPERIKTDEHAFWLGIQGANTWGNDKVSLDDRYQWAKDFSKHAIRIANNPTKELMWTAADDPWQFLSWGFEWAMLHGVGKLNSCMPIAMDATNNGLQILSCLTRDTFGMEVTNCLPTDTPADIYGIVADHAKNQMRKDATEGNEFAPTWLAFDIDRKATKRSCMCLSYGLTAYSNRAYINEWYEEQIHDKGRKAPFDEDERYRATNYLSKVVWQSMEEILHKPKRCMTWFQECARLVADSGKPLFWKSASGFPVHQEYHNLHQQQVNTWISGTATCVKFNEASDQISNRRMINGVSPNVVHSVDSAALHLTTCRANDLGIWDFSMIHDSYSTHATKTTLLNETLRNVFVELFSVDILADWLHQQMEAHPRIDFPAPPSYGDADINAIKHSKYFFS